jgi:hypothetical protein
VNSCVKQEKGFLKDWNSLGFLLSTSSSVCLSYLEPVTEVIEARTEMPVVFNDLLAS